MHKAAKNGKVKRASGRPLTARQKRELTALAALPDDQIDTSDIPELPPEAWMRFEAGSIVR
jgi:hypothetical protein